MAPILRRVDDTLEIELTGRWSDIADAKEKVKDIPGRRWNPQKKVWVVPADPALADRLLKTLRPEADDELMAWLKQSMTSEEESLTTPLPDDAELLLPWATKRMPWQPEYVNDEKFEGALPYQRAMIDRMASNRRMINAADMGLGKSIMALSAVAEFLLRYRSEQNKLEESRGSSAVQSRLWRKELREDSSSEQEWGGEASRGSESFDRREEISSLRGLQDFFASGMYGPGSRSGPSFVQHRPVAGDSTALWRVAKGRGYSRNGEVRGSMPELPPFEALAGAPKLIVCPATVAGSWAREVTRWTNDPYTIAMGSSRQKRERELQEAAAQGHWVICNWEQLRIEKVKVKLRNGGTKTVKQMRQPLFEEIGWLAVIADEVHRAKNKNAAQSQGLWRLQAPLMFGLSGTPLMNSPDELWAPLRWLFPDEFHERGAAHSEGAQAYWTFYNEYVEFWEDHFGKKVVTGVKNPDGLRFVLKDKMVRTTASVLGLKGRKRFYYDVPMTPAQARLYAEAETAMWLEVRQEAASGDRKAQELVALADEGASTAQLMRIPNGAARFVRLQQILENAALLGGPDESGVMDDFEQKFVDSRPHAWVVFCKYKDSCDLLADRTRRKYGANVEVYNGDVSRAHRTDIEDAFQRGEIDVLVGTIAAMYQGITLTHGHLQHWLSREVVPAINEQGEAREDRLGQQELVRVYIPQAPDTVATDKVHVINRLKESIVKTVIPQDHIEEETND